MHTPGSKVQGLSIHFPPTTTRKHYNCINLISRNIKIKPGRNPGRDQSFSENERLLQQLHNLKGIL